MCLLTHLDSSSEFLFFPQIKKKFRLFQTAILGLVVFCVTAEIVFFCEDETFVVYVLHLVLILASDWPGHEDHER
jgi:Na+/melibiose symporter-like transporter